MSVSPRPQQRTSQTCVTCRARKVRCDGRRGICTNCERLGFACSYDENVAIEVIDSPVGTSISVPRRRVRQACLSCHAKKARCSGQAPKCDRCRIQGLECLYRPGKRSAGAAGHRASSTGEGNPRDSLVPSDGQDAAQGTGSVGDYFDPSLTIGSPTGSAIESLCPDESFEVLSLKAFDKFFRHIHHIPTFSFLHRASLMERYTSGLLDRPLLLSLIGITSLFTDLGQGMKEFGSRCVDEAASLILADIEKPSILRVQALIIITKHRTLSRRFSSAFMLHGIACRFATALRLNRETPSLGFLARESRRRLMWSLYMVDTGIASGQTDFALWADPEHQIQIQLPCNERNFEFDLPEPTELLRSPIPGAEGTVVPLSDGIGFLAIHIRIHWLRSRIQQYTTGIVANPSIDAIAQLPARCAELATELEVFAARLPLSFRWSEANLKLRTYSPRLGIYMMTHLWWEQCHCDLYRLWLSRFQQALPDQLINQMNGDFVRHCRQQCYKHARVMADMFSQLLGMGNDIPISDLDLPVCAYQCARLLFHGFRTSALELRMTAESVRELAGVCLRIAKQCTAGSAAESIQVEMEKLLANGISTTLNEPTMLETPVTIPPSAMVSSNLAAQEPMAPPPMAGQRQTFDAVATQMGSANLARMPQHLSPSMAQQDEIARRMSQSGAVSVATHLTTGSNAFEGALDALDFGMDSYGVDPAVTFSSELLDAEFDDMEM